MILDKLSEFMGSFMTVSGFLVWSFLLKGYRCYGDFTLQCIFPNIFSVTCQQNYRLDIKKLREVQKCYGPSLSPWHYCQARTSLAAGAG